MLQQESPGEAQWLWPRRWQNGAVLIVAGLWRGTANAVTGGGERYR